MQSFKSRARTGINQDFLWKLISSSFIPAMVLFSLCTWAPSPMGVSFFETSSDTQPQDSLFTKETGTRLDTASFPGSVPSRRFTRS